MTCNQDCDYSLCLKCSFDGRIDQSRPLDVKKCSHPLLPFSYEERGGIVCCDMCKENLESGIISFSCMECFQFNACKECLRYIRSVSNVEPPSNPDALFLKDSKTNGTPYIAGKNFYLNSLGAQEEFQIQQLKCHFDLNSIDKIYNYEFMTSVRQYVS